MDNRPKKKIQDKKEIDDLVSYTRVMTCLPVVCEESNAVKSNDVGITSLSV